MRPWLAAIVMLACVSGALAHDSGVIHDPDGYVNVRAEKRVDAAVIGTVKSNEPFALKPEEGAEWLQVTLKNGKSGWMHHSRIRLFFTDKELPTKADDNRGNSELSEASRAQGFVYSQLVRDAARGKPAACRKFFGIEFDGAAAESHFAVVAAVFHLIGDEKFAAYLRAQPVEHQVAARNSIASDTVLYPFSAGKYLRRHFPKTTALFFRREITGWPSPNGRYAIRKAFSEADERDYSKVVRAELIETSTGKVLYDLTGDDIGKGADREGKVLWAPDSRRLAYMSGDLTHGGNLFAKPPPAPRRKQTTVYQFAGESFVKVDLPIDDVPGREKDEELRGALLGHEHIEPLRWAKPDLLILQRHEYFRKLKPTKLDGLTFESVHDLSRLYEITVRIAADGRATVKNFLQKKY